MRNKLPRRYHRSNWTDMALGLGLISTSVILFIGYFWFALSYDCRWQLKLSSVSQHLCYVLGY